MQLSLNVIYYICMLTVISITKSEVLFCLSPLQLILINAVKFYNCLNVMHGNNLQATIFQQTSFFANICYLSINNIWCIQTEVIDLKRGLPYIISQPEISFENPAI